MNSRLNSRYLQRFMIIGILLVLCVVFAVMSEEFFTYINIRNILRQQSMVAITAAGATFVMITTGLDISVGSTIALSGVVFAKLVQGGMPLLPACLIAILVGGIVGLINASMIVGAKINPVIATLGSMYAVRGIAYLVAGGTTIANGLPKNFNVLGRGYIGPVPIPVVIMILVYIVFHFVLSRTLLGKYTYAIGGNKETARLSGISVAKVMVLLYVITGLLTGLSGTIMASRLTSGNPQIGTGFEFDVIIAVFLGGVSTTGGEGTIVGTFIGAMIVGVLSNGLNLLGVDPFYQYIIKGIVLVLAVMLDMALKGNGLSLKSLNKRILAKS
ncbi:ABC transporter permease [Vallitalea guaymasensis]|uniref:ABC transporter permease n=1 Tax=Vallitalea guaymasensis TaxID=1185412 RepID=A0A8J8MDI9_9FIRM|nr:ABC transporter permease [Vallitalea guaymasensis]QUH30838.1 ABC transporter permease [Vallitalea guaymasensis]